MAKKFKRTDKYKVAPVKKSFAKVVGSSEQQAIWKAVSSTQNNLIVRARAGTGKTFTSIQSLHCLAEKKCGSAGFVAFNRSIAEELATKIPEEFEAKTLHGLGYRMLRDAYGRVEIMRSCKTRFLLKKILGTDNIPWNVYSPVERLVDLAKGCGSIVAQDFDDQLLLDLCVEHDLEIDPSRSEYLFDLVRNVLEKSDAMNTLIDFGDMIRLPLFTTPKFKYDVLFVDEAQDLNRSQQELASLVAKRMVLVGDDRQSIYGFRGADTASLANMQTLLEDHALGCAVLPLTESRRCPKSHVLLAQSLVPDFRHLDTAIEGNIYEARLDGITQLAKPGDLIVSRVNAPLVRLAYRFLQSNIRCRIQGRDFSKTLTVLIQNLCRDMTTGIYEFLELLEQYRDRELMILSESASSRAAQQIESLNDRCDCLAALCENKSPESTVADLISQIESLFADEPISLEKKSWNYVLLSSVHRAKGLEARNVFVLTGKMPIPFAKSDSAILQELNIIYVAITRSLENLYFVGMLPPCLSLPKGYSWQAVTPNGPIAAQLIETQRTPRNENQEAGSGSEKGCQNAAEDSSPKKEASSGINRQGNLHDLPKTKSRQAPKQNIMQSVPPQNGEVHEGTTRPSSSRSKSTRSQDGEKSAKKGRSQKGQAGSRKVGRR